MIAWANTGARENDWIIAESQTSGRGRLGRSWNSSAGNFFGSTMVKLREGDPEPATLSMLAAIFISDGIRHFTPDKNSLALSIKWPNDLLFNGAKIAGILLERREQFVVIGIGVNIASAPALDDRSTACIRDFWPHPLTPDGFFAGLAQFNWLLMRWRRQGLPWLREEWLRRAHPIGTPLTVKLGEGAEVAGLFAGLNHDGSLSLRLADGTIRAIHAGDVFLI